MLIEQLSAFSAYLADHYAVSTRYSYTSRTRSYLQTLPDDSSFTESHIRAYINRMGDKRRPATCRSALASIYKFGAFLVEKGLLPDNPAERVKAPRPDKPYRETPTEPQVTALMDACDRIYHPYRRALARAVVYTLVMSASRRSELLALRVNDIDLESGTIYIRHGKGNRARVVKPASSCIVALRDYLAVRPPCKKERLFLLRKGFVLGDQGLRILLRELFAIAGMPNNRALLPHGLRHACATRMRANKVELEEIKEFLGHSDINTTILYLHRPAERAKEIAELTDPRAAAAPSHNPPLSPPPDPAPAPRPALRLVLVDGGTTQKERPAG